MLKIQQLAKAASVAALTVGVAFGAQPAQKASAQVITGAGASSVTTLLNTSSSPVLDYVTSFGSSYRYVVTGSGAGRTAFQNGQTDFVATDGLGNIDPNDPNLVIVNEATLNVAFPVNLGGSGIDLSIQQACDVINGNVTNWSEVGGPNLAIRRVARGDNSGTTNTLNNGFIIPFCGTPGIPNPPVDDSGQSTLANARLAGSIDPISGEDDSDIIVFPAPDPFNSGDDLNSGSYSLGVVNTVQSTLGAAGYAETALAASVGANLATNNGQSTIAVGPTYVVFRRNYLLPDGTQDLDKVIAAQDVCYGAIFSGFLTQAGFNVDSSVFPYNVDNSPEAGADTDNYGDLDTFFGPCSTIGN